MKAINRSVCAARLLCVAAGVAGLGAQPVGARQTTAPTAPAEKKTPFSVASAGKKTEEEKGRVILVVHSLRDAGGLPTEGRDTGMGEQFADGLRQYLGEAAKNRFVVATDTKASPTNARVLHLDGDLSRTEDGKGGGSYLAVIRLSQETGKGTRRVIAQWAGIAENYRYLTGNLENRSDVDSEGLLGEMGKRIAGVIAASPKRNAAFDAFVKAAQNEQVLAFVVPEARDKNGKNDKPHSVAAPVLHSSQGFRVQVASKNEGSVYVVRDEGDRLLPLSLPESDTARRVEPGKPLLLPETKSKAWVAPQVDQRKEQTLLVLVRRQNKPNPPVKSVQAAFTRTADTACKTFGDDENANDDKNAPVRVVSTGGAIPDDSDPAIAHLTQLFASDPAGTWSAHRLVVRIVPIAPPRKP